MTTRNETLDGRVALLTGGGRGIGRAVALGLASGGARVAVLARSADEVEQTAKLVDERGGTAIALTADVTDSAQLDAALDKLHDQWGPVEVLVNNAAVVWPLGASASLDPDEWARAIDINLTAIARLSFALLPAMLHRGWGRIVNVSSSIAAHPASMLRANAYATSKAALEAHTLNLAAELAGTGVTVNVFRPGGVDTAMQAWIRAQNPRQIGVELHDRFTRNHDQGALLTPEQSASSATGPAAQQRHRRDLGRRRPHLSIPNQTPRVTSRAKEASTMTLLNPEDAFPNITLTTPGGPTLTLPDEFAGGFGVVLFYRGSWCPYCNAQLRAFQRASDALAEVGAKVIALSVDDEATTAATIAKHGLSFPVGHSADAAAVSKATGAFVDPAGDFLQSTGFVLDPAGKVVVSVYSSGAIGRLVPEDVIGLIRYLREHATSTASA